MSLGGPPAGTHHPEGLLRGVGMVLWFLSGMPSPYRKAFLVFSGLALLGFGLAYWLLASGPSQSLWALPDPPRHPDGRLVAR